MDEGERAIKILMRRQIINSLLIFSLILVICGTIYLIYTKSNGQFFLELKKFEIFKSKSDTISLKPVAIVNNEEISSAELEEAYNMIPDAYKQFISKDKLLEQIIDEKLLIQEAKKKGIVVSDSEIEAEIDRLLNISFMTKEQLLDDLKIRNISYDKVKDFYKKQLTLKKLFESVFDFVITEKEIEDYYKNNTEQFKIPESINVSHILICHNESIRCLSNLTKEEAKKEAEEIRKLINETNFAEIAKDYSFEPTAKISAGNLGWVSKEDPFDQTFLDAAFNLSVNETSKPVETMFGFHIIKVFDKKDAGILNLSDVYDQINQTLTSEKQMEEYTKYLNKIKNSSIIIKNNIS